MSERSLTIHVEQTAEIIRRLITLKPRLRVKLPEDLARARARLPELHTGGPTKKGADY